MTGNQGRLRADPAKHRKYETLARGPYFTPVVAVARAYVQAAIVPADGADPTATEGEYWALSCLPTTTPRRLSALTMRITDMLVIYRASPEPARDTAPAKDTAPARGTAPAQPAPVQPAPVEALMIVERSALEGGFGSRAQANRRYPRLLFTDSDFHGAGTDQMLIRGPWAQLARALADERIGFAARQLAQRMMRSGRVMHWRGHNPLLADHVLARDGDDLRA